MTRAGRAYALPTSEPPTAATDGSLLPTPRVAADRTGRTSMVGPAHWAAPSLAQAVELAQGILPREFQSWDEVPGGSRKLLPTPQAADGDGGRIDKEIGGTRPSGAKRAVTLGTAVHHHLLPTPRTTDANGSGPHGDGGPDLRTVIAGLPGDRSNPRSADGNTSPAWPPLPPPTAKGGSAPTSSNG
jgi:hypothetical protein